MTDLRRLPSQKPAASDWLADGLVTAAMGMTAGLGIWLSAGPAPVAARHVGTAAAVQVADYSPWRRPAAPVTAVPVTEGARADLTPDGHQPEALGGFRTALGAPLADAVFHASNHGNDDSFYGGDWTPENIQPEGGGARLDVRRWPTPADAFSAAEMQSHQTYGYGRYEAIMRPAKGSGLVTAFFTYTGPWFGDPHDEIDIEFLGTDTTRIHFNYFRKGERGKAATFDLPFDAGDADRLYAFEWRPEGITWFVENEPVYATVAGAADLPVAAGKVMFSVWTGKPHMQAWHGAPDFGPRASAGFKCVSFSPLGKQGPRCSDGWEAGGSR